MAAEPDMPLKRSTSFPLLPPDMSELSVVLLGNSWIQRSSVGNLLLNETKFDTKKEPEKPVRQSGELQEKKLHVINAPDLLQPDLTADRLTELVTEIAETSSPGPHVFVLVLQPEDFTEQHKTRLESVLERFSEQAFDRSLLLLSTPREETPGFMETYMEVPHLRDMIIKCKNQYLWMNLTEYDKTENLKHKNILTRIIEIVNKQNGKPLLYDIYKALKSAPSTKEFSDVAAIEKEGNTAVLGPSEDFTIMLFGKSDDKKTKLTNFITGARIGAKSSVASGKWRGNRLTVVKTPDLLSLSVKTVREEIKRYVSPCSSGPNVLLLLVRPSDFTESDRTKLKFILDHFGPDAFKHSMVILTHNKNDQNRSVDHLIGDCEGKHYNMSEKDLDQLMEKIQLIVDKNPSFLTFTEKKKRSLNLVLCGRTGALKTSVAQSILGQTLQCDKHQREVCGRWLSLVELPALSGKPPETVIKQCLHCISLCGPEGVHAFLLVLPVGPLTDEDKTELKIIQDSLSPRALLFSMIVFTVDSDPTAPAVVNFVKGHRDLQKLYERCGGGYFIFNTRNQQQVTDLLDYAEAIHAKNEPKGFTTETLVMALHQEIQDLKSKSTVRSNDNLSSDSLRIVLIGKTGCGKSSSGNTILGEKKFTVELSQNSVTKLCRKVSTKVDGRCVEVVDTPGSFDTNLSPEDINKEMVKCISLLAPGPHVFLLVIKLDRFTLEEKEAIRLIKEGFGKDADRFIIILFTHGDELEEHNMSIEKYIEGGGNNSFNQLLSDCGNRYHVFNNRNKPDRTQVQELLQKIDHMVKENGGKFYTNDILQEAEAAINKETERLLQEKNQEMKKEREEMERKHKQAMEELKQKMDKQKEEFELEKLQREQQLEEKIREEKEQQEREQEKRKEEDIKRNEQDEQKRQEYERKYKELEQKIRSEEKSNEETESKLQESRRQMEQWEKEKEEWWEQRKLEDEARRLAEQQKQKQYEQEREELNKRLEQERLRREEEEKKMKALEEEYQTKLEEMEKEKENYKEEARTKAEELNDFQKKTNREFEDRKHEYERSIKDKDEKYDLLKALAAHNESQKMEVHQREIINIVKCVSKNRSNMKNIHKLLIKHDEQMKHVHDEEEKRTLLKVQEKEVEDLVQNFLKEKSLCGIL